MLGGGVLGIVPSLTEVAPVDPGVRGYRWEGSTNMDGRSEPIEMIEEQMIA
jgi:hypothetical protein